MTSQWSSLEIAKLVLSAATPLLILVLGVWFQRFATRFEQLQWANRKIVEKRLAVYDDVAPMLNDLLCYFSYVGSWKELTPRQLVDSKRLLDRKMHLAAPIFSVQLLSLYNNYIGLCFQTYNEMGADARLRTRPEDRRPYSRQPWDESWDQLFAPEAFFTDPRLIVKAYEELISWFARELGLGIRTPHTILEKVEHHVLTTTPASWWMRLFPRDHEST